MFSHNVIRIKVGILTTKDIKTYWGKLLSFGCGKVSGIKLGLVRIAARKIIILIYFIVYIISNKKLYYNSVGENPFREVDKKQLF